MIDEEELLEFRRWKREFKATEFERIFYELHDLIYNPNAKHYNSVMPVGAFRIMANSVLMLKDRVLELEESLKSRGLPHGAAQDEAFLLQMD